MFKDTLAKRLEKVFGLPVRFTTPGEDYEQDVMFVIFPEANKTTFSDDKIKQVVKAVAGVRSNKLKFGWCEMKIQTAPVSVSKLFFFKINNQASQKIKNLDILETEIEITFFYEEQFNKPNGKLVGLDLVE